MMQFRLAFITLLSFVCLVSSSFASLENKAWIDSNSEEFLPVEQAYTLSIDVNQNTLTLVWDLAENYYLYKHGFANELIHQGSVTTPDFAIPPGIEKEDEYFGKVEVFYNQVAIPLALANTDTGIYYLKTSSQGCADAGLCYPPYHLYFKVDLDADTVTPIDKAAYQSLKPGSQSATPSSQAPDQTGDTALLPPVPSLAFILLSAFLGGLILNLMPCVFPVLSIKVFQIAKHSEHGDDIVQGLTYMLGVVLSFIIIAGLMLALRSAGKAVGWGFQLQNPLFISALVYLFFILGFGMLGQIQIGSKLMGIGQSLTGKKGVSGAFFTGVLAVIVASPCTAPMMGTALGYAIAQPPAIALLVFGFLGLGMAMPLTLISIFPAASKLLPEPGEWMEKLKEFFAFPLFATAIWLAWVLGNQTSTTGMALILLGALFISFATWCFQGNHVFAKIIGLLALLLTLWIPFTAPLQLAKAGDNNRLEDHQVAFSKEKLQQLRSQGQAVFVDLTADWCITCIANEKSTLETPEIQQAFKDANIVYMVGDWTHYNPEITELLETYNRSGIPLYLLFPPRQNATALILPQLLSDAIILDAIEKTSKM